MYLPSGPPETYPRPYKIRPTAKINRHDPAKVGKSNLEDRISGKEREACQQGVAYEASKQRHIMRSKKEENVWKAR